MENQVKQLSIGELERKFFDGKLFSEMTEEEKQQIQEENKEVEELEKKEK